MLRQTQLMRTLSFYTNSSNYKIQAMTLNGQSWCPLLQGMTTKHEFRVIIHLVLILILNQ